MPKHYCLDPYDPFAEREVLVTFERQSDDVRLLAVIDADADDILANLSDIQRDDLRRELAEAGWPLARKAGDWHPVEAPLPTAHH